MPEDYPELETAAVARDKARLPAQLARSDRFSARAMFVGEYINQRQFAADARLATHPLVISLGPASAAVLFRYGAVVLFNANKDTEEALLRDLTPLISQPCPTPETEEVTLCVAPGREEEIESPTVFLRELTIERLQVVAAVLSKSVVLAEYEARIAENFDRIEPFAVELQKRGPGGRRMKDLLQQIGRVLLTEHKMVARVEVREKPEVLWEHPELESLYLRLEDEFEIRERYTALERKLALTSRTVSTMLELLHNRTSLRVEWYIVILIVLEIALTLYQMAVH